MCCGVCWGGWSCDSGGEGIEGIELWAEVVSPPLVVSLRGEARITLELGSGAFRVGFGRAKPSTLLVIIRSKSFNLFLIASGSSCSSCCSFSSSVSDEDLDSGGDIGRRWVGEWTGMAAAGRWVRVTKDAEGVPLVLLCDECSADGDRRLELNRFFTPIGVACRGVDAVEARMPAEDTLGGVILEVLSSCRRGDGMASGWAPG